MEKFLNLHEVAKILGKKEKEVVKLSDQGVITAYRIGGSLLRFKLADVYEYIKKKSAQDKDETASGEKYPKKIEDFSETAYSLKDRIYDFFYYHDFYIVIILVITLFLIIIFKF